MKKLIIYSLLLLGVNAFATETTKKSATQNVTPENSRVYFVNLKDGQTIPQEFKVQFGVEGVALKKAGDAEDKKTGHHHLLINQGPTTAGQIIPNDADHMHFGQAQTETTLKLKPGNYTLTLQLADGAHRSYGEKLSATVKVTVK